MRIRHVIIGIFLHVKMTTLNRDASSVRSASPCTLRVTINRAKNVEEKCWKRNCCLIEEFDAIGLRIPEL